MKVGNESFGALQSKISEQKYFYYFFLIKGLATGLIMPEKEKEKFLKKAERAACWDAKE